MIVMSRDNLFFTNRLMKVHQLLSTYDLFFYKSEDFVATYDIPESQTEIFDINRVPAIIKRSFMVIKRFLSVEAEFPIFITILVNGIDKFPDGFYTFDFNQDAVQRIADSQNTFTLDKNTVSFSYFIEADKIQESSRYTDYIKSCIEIGRLDQLISESLKEVICVGRKFFPTNMFTKTQKIDLTKKMLTQTTIFKEVNSNDVLK